MQRLLLTLDTPAQNLALDEALLDWLEQDSTGASAHEVLRIWESTALAVVVGRSSKLEEEVDLAACAEHGIPILRRPSGGATVLIGPGCLMFALLLSCQKRHELRAVDRAHAFVLGRHVEFLRPAFPNIRTAGISDLVLADQTNSGSWKKVSGNSIRLKRNHLLYHGTLLYDFDLSLISKCLRAPSRQPEYRQKRAHSEFVTNLPTTRAKLEEGLLTAWKANEELATWPQAIVKTLAEKNQRDLSQTGKL